MGTYKRWLTDDEGAELVALNMAVEQAIRVRREWLDAKMHECSALQPGDEIYDVNSGRLKGVVRGLDRYHRNQGGGYWDNSLDFFYEFSKTADSNCIDNTASLPFHAGTKADAVAEAKRKLESLKE